ncbi:MAG: hypothetical protein O7E54_04860 [Planctomycetota bacterium]|nr:hypothetical protein [Planctomycetota bacterium]
MKRVASIGIVSLLCACSGGGSNPPPAGAQPLTTQEATDLLSSCVAPDLEQVRVLLDLLQGIADTQSLPDDFDFSINLNGTVSWSLPVDLDGDGRADTMADGSFHFENAGGRTIIPFNIFNPPRTLQDLLAGLGNGDALVLDFRLTPGDDGIHGSGTITTAFQRGTIDSVSGDGEFESDACTFTFEFDGLTLDDLRGPYPTGIVDFTVDDGQREVSGKIDFDGTAQAIAELNGEMFQVDLSGRQVVVTPL